jgi:hypothetical protein
MMSNNFAFPHGELTKVIGLPTNTSLQVLKSQLCNDAASVPSRRGGGAHGHHGIVMDAVDYMIVSNNIPWVDPVHPGELTVHGTGATAILHKLINCQYDADLAAYELYSKVSNAVKRQILLDVVNYLPLIILFTTQKLYGFCSKQCGFTRKDDKFSQKRRDACTVP